MIENEGAPRFQARMNILEHAAILGRIVEVAERSKYVDREIKCRWPDELPHILLDPFDLHSGAVRSFSRFAQQEWRAIDARHRVTGQCQRNCVPPRTASQIQNAAAGYAAQCGDLRDI